MRGRGIASSSNSAIIYLDESGDLGWTFTAPYRRGGSSRYLTITAVCVAPEKKHLPKRLIKSLYGKFGWDPKAEKKWSAMESDERTAFVHSVQTMLLKHPDIALHAIVVKKENVQSHIQTDPNKLYNYMIRLALLDRMAKHDVVTLIPDPRSIKVASGNSLHDYLQMQLWFEKKATTTLITSPSDSAQNKGLQFADMLAGLVQGRFEDNASADFQVISKHITINKLYF